MKPADPGYHDLVVESWILWGVAIATAICRLVSRWLNLGSFSKFQADDYLMLLAMITVTGVVVTAIQVSINGSNYVSDEDALGFTPEERRHAIWGSKMLIALEEFMLATLWLVKACLLVFYYRMTSLFYQGLVVKMLGIYCVVTYVIIQILYLGVWCRPIYNYWAVPVPPGWEQCKTYRHHMITVSAFHISSDLAMLGVPLPLIIRSTLPWRRKLLLCSVFGVGVVVVVIAILNRYYNFTDVNSLVFLNWYTAEATAAVMIANIPLCWALVRRVFLLDSWGTTSNTNGGRGFMSFTLPNGAPPTIGTGGRGRGRSGGGGSMISGNRRVYRDDYAARAANVSDVTILRSVWPESPGNPENRQSPESPESMERIAISTTSDTKTPQKHSQDGHELTDIDHR